MADITARIHPSPKVTTRAVKVNADSGSAAVAILRDILADRLPRGTWQVGTAHFVSEEPSRFEDVLASQRNAADLHTYGVDYILFPKGDAS